MPVVFRGKYLTQLNLRTAPSAVEKLVELQTAGKVTERQEPVRSITTLRFWAPKAMNDNQLDNSLAVNMGWTC